MEYILITLKYKEKTEDLKVPASISVIELIEILCEIYLFKASSLYAEPKGIILDKNKTLEEQGVLHGALLTVS